MADPTTPAPTPGAGGRLRVHVGLGSNLGDRWAQLAEAVEGLRAAGEEVVVSPVYETVPVGGPPGQGRYLNCVVRMTVHLSPEEVLEVARGLEAAAARARDVRWGPRTLDVDVLLVETEDGQGGWAPLAVDTPDLAVPHPRLAERAFVLAPLEDVSPELVEEGWRDRLGGEEAVSAAVRKVGEIVAKAERR